MSFPPAIAHLEQAMAHAKAQNAAKAMHHIGHAMLHLRGMTSGAGGASKLPAPAPMDQGAPNDNQDSTQGQQPPNPGSLRAKLASMNGGGAMNAGGY